MKTFSDYIQEAREEKESTITESLEVGKDGKYHPKTRKEVQDLLFSKKINATDIDVSDVLSFENLFIKVDFNKYPSLKGISEWDTSHVTNMFNTFAGAKNIPDLSKWNVSKVETMYCMFLDSDFNGDISKWNVKTVKDMSQMFTFSKFNGNISKWNVSNNANLDEMFAHCPLEKNPPSWYREYINRENDIQM